jgi:hypothetical protein
MGSAMGRLVGAAILCAAVVFLVGAGAIAAPKVMTDDELDEVSASGGINLDLTTDPTSLHFSFDNGTMLGAGSVTASPATAGPSTLAFQGTADFTNARIAVDNMIFNLNICVQCQGSIFQSGIGIPISIKTGP